MNNTSTLPELLSITYTSAAVRPPTAEQLQMLLDKARKRNELEDVTGVLLYADGTFHQYIEGPAEGLMRVYEAILRDPLHHHIFEMLREPIAAREFAGWSMGYQGAEIIEGTVKDAALSSLLADESARLSGGRLLLNAFWSKGLGARYLAALASKRT